MALSSIEEMQYNFYDLEICKDNIKKSLIEVINNFDDIENIEKIIKRYELTVNEVNSIIKIIYKSDKNYKKNNKLLLKYYNDNLYILLEKLKSNFRMIKLSYKNDGILSI